MTESTKHENYEILNLIGYGLSKFNNTFIAQFGFTTKTDFYNYCVSIGLCDTGSVVKNRMDLFDPFFPNDRKGWWQKGDTYIHRKHFIDNLFGNESVEEYTDIVKMYLKDNFNILNLKTNIKPIIQSRFKKLQETGLEAELFFINNYQNIQLFNGAQLDDARLYGDGYDFQMKIDTTFYLAEVKGIRAQKGRFRLTENEYMKAQEYKEQYIITIVSNLNDIPTFLTIEDPIKNLQFIKRTVSSKDRNEYHLKGDIC
jgi:hypothetical protein